MTRHYVGKIKRSPRINKRNPHKAYGTRKRRNINRTKHQLIDAGAFILDELKEVIPEEEL